MNPRERAQLTRLLEECFKCEYCLICKRTIRTDQDGTVEICVSDDHGRINPDDRHLRQSLASRVEKGLGPPPGIEFNHYHRECLRAHRRALAT